MIRTKKYFLRVFGSAVNILAATFLFFGDFAFSATVNNAYLHQGGIPPAPRDLSNIACSVVKVSLDFIPYLLVFAVVDFMIGLIKYIRHGDNEEKRREGGKRKGDWGLGVFFFFFFCV